MKFRNTTGDTLDVPALGVSVAPGDDLELADADAAAGFVHQCSTVGGVWAPADDEASGVVDAATAALERDASTVPPVSAPKADWVAHALAQGDPDAGSKTKAELIAEHGGTDPKTEE